MKKRIIFSFGILLFVILFQGGTLRIILSQVHIAEEAKNVANTMTTEVNAIEMKHYRWLQELTLALYDGAEFSGSLDSETCSLGAWMASGEVSEYPDETFHDLINALVEPHNQIHLAAAEILSALQVNNTNKAVDIFHNSVVPNMNLTINGLDKINLYAEDVMKVKAQESNVIYNASTLFVVVLLSLSLIVGLLMMFILIRKIVPPLKKLTKAATDLSIGNMEIEIDVHSKDELGDFTLAFQKMAAGMKEQSEVLNRISNCDYTMVMPIRSDKDVINQSINQMLQQYNTMLKDLRIVSNNVASGAQQIASSSQSLATGSVEQASSVQLFSNTITQVLAQAKQNSALAEQTATDMSLAGCIMRECLAYMQEMQIAIKAIRDSSKEIAKVSSLIEDIAFQTNILALNAAVEAARAGKDGKGFSVVAGEVRTLAGKSAVATKETKDLVESSIQNIVRGMGITEKTEESLNNAGKIVELNVKAMEKISHSTDAQTVSLNEITQGIEQISIVVQSNSDNAVESAVGADHLNAQGRLMRDIVSQFQLRE